ncbi:hypothetical protein ACFQX7_28115 [Luedemannella flava]
MYDPLSDDRISGWEVTHHLIRVLESEGIAAAGALLARARSRPDGVIDPDLVKELAFLLFRVADGNRWVSDAVSFNTLATSWADIVDASQGRAVAVKQPLLDLDEEE